MSTNNTLTKSSKLRVMTILGTRPELIRLSRVIAKLDFYCDHILTHTGQNFDYELNEIFFNDLNVRRPDLFLECAGASPAETISQVIFEADKVFVEFKPEAILILGDTNSAVAAIAAKRRKIPIFHMEAGNRCFDLRVPEEINRKIIDHISDVNMPYTDIAREYLIREGIKPDLIVKTGSPMDEVLSYYKEEILNANILERLDLSKNKYFVISLHREENLDSKKNLNEFVKMLDLIGKTFEMPIIVSTHPRTRKKIKELKLEFHSLVQLQKPYGFFDYLKLQINAKAVLSDSGTITEESSILNFPAINLRDAHERPEGMEEGAVIFTGINCVRILQALAVLENQDRREKRSINVVKDYIAPNVSEKVVRIIQSYTNYINEFTWRK